MSELDGFEVLPTFDQRTNKGKIGYLSKRIAELEERVAELEREGGGRMSDYHGYEQAAIEAWGNIKAWNTRAIKAWNTRAAHGTLTAEQVRKVLLYHLPPREYYSVEQTDAWQAIADELNAALGGDDKSRWFQMFGTPEKTAEHFAMQCFGSDGSMCHYCPFDDCDGKLRNSGAYPSVHDALLEWLRGDAE